MSSAGDRHSKKPTEHGEAVQTGESMVHDEVCGMDFPAAQAAATAGLGGKTYHFCSKRCRERFLEHPGWYVPVEP